MKFKSLSLGLVVLASYGGAIVAQTATSQGIAMGATQSATPPQLAFDVVSVKVRTVGEQPVHQQFPENGTWRVIGLSLTNLISDAYDTPQWNIEGIPSSFRSADALFDITAKTRADVSQEDFRLMLQATLADRFHFAMHRAERLTPVYPITVDKDGLKLLPASGKCGDLSIFPKEAKRDLGPIQNRFTSCGVFYAPQFDTSWSLFGWSVSIADLVRRISPPAKQFVDDTGINGLFDIDLSLNVGPSPNGSPLDHLIIIMSGINDPADQQAFARSLREQAGLFVNFKPVNQQLPTIVIDRVEMPRPN